MIVTGSKQGTSRMFGVTPGEVEPHEAPVSGGRALVVIAPVEASQEPIANYRQAPFLAQLIATRDQLPQTRERRRAEPGEAIAAYRATEALIKH
jgi:hypothetical protein